MAHSTAHKQPRKRSKAQADFPLWKHPSGRWCKKVRGKFCYFGKVADDPNGLAALDRWLDEKDDWLAGRTPRQKTGAVTVKDACNEFLVFKQDQLRADELAQRSFDLYLDTSERLIDSFGARRAIVDLTPADFQTLRSTLANGHGPVWLGNEIQRVRTVFRYAHEYGLIDRPVRFGPAFKKPSAKTIRQNRQKNGPRLFERAEVLAVLEHATTNAKAMVLLALNCGLGNTDLALLPIHAIDLETGILDFARSKTAIERVVPLWPETVAAVRAALAERREPNNPEHARLLFIGRRGEDYVGNRKGTRVHQELRRVLAWAKVTGRTFYDLRRTFQTVAEASRDLPAVSAIMGHAPASGDMAAIYRQRVEMDRKRAVVNCVRDWLFAAVDEREGGSDER